MRFLASSLAAVLLGCAPAPPTAEIARTPAQLKLQESCETVAWVDKARIPSPDWSWVEPVHERARGNDSEAPAGSPVLHAAIRAAGVGAPLTEVSILAARQGDGRWAVSYARYQAVPPPPRGPDDRTEPPPNGVFRQGRLTPEAGAVIDAALASECLQRQPNFQPSTLPMKGGEDQLCPPDASGVYALEIVRPNGSRRFAHECGRLWASGLIIATLDNWDSLEGTGPPPR